MSSLQPASKPWWQQATALVSLSAGGAITGFSFMPKAAVDFSSPTSLPVNLLALQHSVRQAPASDATLRSAIVNVAQHYLQLAQDKTPAEMEAMIWQQDSLDHADHGPSCAAFASLTLELAAKVVGQQSWVTGGSSYPWPLHTWADVRVDENPASPGVVSVQQDAQTHGRWHPLGDGYQPQPGDWVLFPGHVEVVTGHGHDVLHTIGGDSLPNFSVNAHQYPGPLASQGVVGFVNNGSLSAAGAASAADTTHGGHGASHAAGTQASTAGTAGAAGQAAIPGTAAATHPTPSAGKHHPSQADVSATQAGQAAALAAIPGSRPASPAAKPAHQAHRAARTPAETATLTGQADIPGAAGLDPAQHRHRHGAGHAGTGHADTRHGAGATDLAAASGGAAIPGLGTAGQHDGSASRPAASGAGHQHQPASTAPVDEASARQAFIAAVAPGAMASQRAYGVPAAVTIAQAIEESNWGQSLLASKDHNLFGMKGTGPAGSEALPTQEYENGQWITTTAPFRVYHNFAESIDDHGRLLAGSGYYGQAMAVRRAPNAFASALTGVYATDPSYGAKLISLMRTYNLYQYDAGSPSAGSAPVAQHRPRPAPSHRTTSRTPAPSGSPTASPSGTPAATPTGTGQPTPAASPAHTPSATPARSGSATPSATPSHTPAAAGTQSPAAS
ncbi:MAG TPA: glucosaminidase domain-containing protein, partial [Streptosporangiaceae bacterium]